MFCQVTPSKDQLFQAWQMAMEKTPGRLQLPGHDNSCFVCTFFHAGTTATLMLRGSDTHHSVPLPALLQQHPG
jgi:hypothetical protein